VTDDFTNLTMLVCQHPVLSFEKISHDGRTKRYGQETITVMTAYSAIILLKVTD